MFCCALISDPLREFIEAVEQERDPPFLEHVRERREIDVSFTNGSQMLSNELVKGSCFFQGA